MRFLFTYGLMIIFVAACGKESSGKLSLTVNNNYIAYVDSTAVVGVCTYKNEDAKNKATNVVTYTLHNTTDRRYVLILDREYLYPHIGENSIRSGSIGYFIRDDAGNITAAFPGVIDVFHEREPDCCDCILKDRVDNFLRLRISKDYSVKADEYLRYAVTIYPGESRTFKTVTMLPVVLERNKNGGGILRYHSLSENETFELVYHCNAKEFSKELPEYLQKELKHNDVEIFDGTLVSNKIPLKVKF